MKKKLLAVLCLAAVLITGCSAIRAVNLPDDPRVYEKGTVESEADGKALGTISYGGNVYVEYAGFTDYYANKLGDCLGYVDTGSDVPEVYVFTVAGDPEEEYLVTVNAMTHGVPVIYRSLTAVDELTCEDTEKYGYLFWE